MQFGLDLVELLAPLVVECFVLPAEYMTKQNAALPDLATESRARTTISFPFFYAIEPLPRQALIGARDRHIPWL